MSHTLKDGTQAVYDNKTATAKYYAKRNQELYMCDTCNRQIKMVSKVAHEQTKGHCINKNIAGGMYPSLQRYHAHNQEQYHCEACNKDIKLVSKDKHELTKGHTRASVLLNLYKDMPRLTPVVNDSVMTFALERDARNREETLLDREAQNAYRECYNRGLTPIITDTTVLA